MYKLVRIESGLYHIKKDNITVAIVSKYKNGYTRVVYHELSGKWIQPAAFNYFSTLANVKRRYDIK